MIPPWIGLLSSIRPSTTPRMPESKARKNPLHSWHQNAPTTSMPPPRRIKTPRAVTVARVAITGDPRRMIPSTIRAIPSTTSQIHLPRIAWSSWRITLRNGVSGRLVLLMVMLLMARREVALPQPV